MCVWGGRRIKTAKENQRIHNPDVRGCRPPPEPAGPGFTDDGARLGPASNARSEDSSAPLARIRHRPCQLTLTTLSQALLSRRCTAEARRHMNLNKADRKVFLPPREKTSRTRTPRKKQDDFNDEVRWRGPLQRALLSPRLWWWPCGWQAEVGAWAGSRGRD